MLFQTAISMFLVLFGFRVNLLETTLLGNLGQGVKHSIELLHLQSTMCASFCCFGQNNLITKFDLAAFVEAQPIHQHPIYKNG